ncbi:MULTISPECIES: protein jag [Brevibacterium]|uniref:Single-stranded nucleic acid binding R3H domain-containing protein n=3 Tax=Brevibacterium casei TaxID=33889 RepID=K9B0X5_9MICO|nr:R3H domain-containing nucleic acid-binding protein [Brevibacterium casei]NJE65828.1 single-stranded DNA-binding protein [Brevibacterium sp. LS14]EKU48457.1 single-stranded nucleic acid binding R3H domain-containing protein [Brevibacterium casei S18]MCT1550785.1 single-stranded DNA-binding protein [Brevibacterium casei]MCT1559931.1 single-stranded DNA-binding protein [Brevibacterium casei]MCT1765511.1 single-stranded DNA-binding protein [Brevibacterium casei]
MSEEAIDDKAAKPTRAELLEEEGEIAADYLEELMDIADIDGDIDIDVADGRAQLSIVCEDEDDSNLRTLVGRDGKTLGALQELVRLAVQTSTGQRSWLMLDIDGYRSSRRDELIRKAEDAIAEVKESGEEFAFKAMNSFERKIIHDQVAKAGLVSESEGEGDGRHVVVRPADD